MLAGLPLDFTGLVVTLLDGNVEVTVSRDHDHGDIGLGSTGNHVLNEIPVARGVNDGVVPLLGEELLGSARDGHTTLTFLLLTIHKEGEGERRLTETLGLVLQFLHFTLIDSTELEDQVTGGGRLTGIDVSADHDGQMFLTSGGHFENVLGVV